MIKFKLKAVLADRELTQKELAERTGLRLPTINDICTGKILRIPVNAIDLICKELECQPADFIKYIPD